MTTAIANLEATKLRERETFILGRIQQLCETRLKLTCEIEEHRSELKSVLEGQKKLQRGPNFAQS